MNDSPHFMEHFSLLPDPRKNERLIRHGLYGILFLAVGAVVSGADGWQTIALWAQSRETWLQQYCTLKNGIPSWFTLRRAFQIIDPGALQNAFAAWMADLQKTTQNAALAIDGEMRMAVEKRGGWRGGRKARHPSYTS